ncbi:MAG: glycerol kinase GlpK [Prevotellaceae bacterium]|jgi:glycerol kinase|nr:glycerol kinase GlpK [Prevotellaceae bacterium]
MIITIDQSTSATKAMLFSETGSLAGRINLAHRQFYPRAGWVEHDAEEIYENTLRAAAQLIQTTGVTPAGLSSLALTNQRETVVVWNRLTGKPVARAVVWQCLRAAEICRQLIEAGKSSLVQARSGLLIDPYFSAGGLQWLLENVAGARAAASRGELLMGTIDAWLIWKLTDGKVHATDYTNASRTMLFNIHTLQWDDELLDLFHIPRSMLPTPLPCDAVFGQTTLGGQLPAPIPIAGVLGDSHGALTGQGCFAAGMGKATYGTGSSVMVNIGEKPADPPQGLVTSIGLAACGRVFYAFEGNIHCTGATIKWLKEQVQLIDSSEESETLARSVDDTGGVYLVPAFAGLGAPWWKPRAKAILTGMTLATNRSHLTRAALESIAYQVKDLVEAMSVQSGITLRELRVDGGPTRNRFLMQFQADLLQATVCPSQVEEASALGAVVMNGFARGKWNSFDQAEADLQQSREKIIPQTPPERMKQLHAGWLQAVAQAIHN